MHETFYLLGHFFDEVTLVIFEVQGFNCAFVLLFNICHMFSLKYV
jgi:hypothetical protein